MKQFFYSLFYYSLLVCFLSTIAGCEVDKDFIENADSGRPMKRQITFQKFKQEIGQTSFSNQVSISNSETGRTMEDFEIDTTLVKVFESDKVVYSMKLEPKFEVIESKFYNLVVYKDSLDQIINDIIEFYPQSELSGTTEQEIGAYLENSLKEIIYSSKIAPVEAPLCLVVDYQYLCYCGNHREGFCEGYCDAGFRWVPVLITVYCSPGGGDGQGPDPISGGEGDGTTAVDPVLPVFDNSAPCLKVKQFLETHPEFKQGLKNLALEAPNAANEKAIVLFNNNVMDSINGAGGKVDIPVNPTNKYIAMAHIHDPIGQGNGTYSVYSLADFTLLGKIDKLHSKIDLDKFVSFLATADGTYYAFTIQNKTKFRNFFNYMKYLSPNITTQERIAYLNMFDTKQELYDRYFERIEPHPNYPFIKEGSTNSEQDLKYLIDFLAEGDFGISILETDVNFETFSEVKKNNTSQAPVVRTPCN